jgi:hypothetical protein
LYKKSKGENNKVIKSLNIFVNENEYKTKNPNKKEGKQRKQLAKEFQNT